MYEHETVKNILETAIDCLIDNFVKEPYIHRCEHSMHCELFNMLSVHRALQGLYPINKTKYKTTLIHKEWPETNPRKDKEGKIKIRGNFDLAILDPTEIKNCKVNSELKAFSDGLIPPAFVVEMGLNYDLTHLKDDYDKLTNSKCTNYGLDHYGKCSGYLVHLWQPHKGIRKNNITELIDWIEKEDKIHQIAAVVFVKEVALVKHLHSNTFITTEI